MGKLVKPVKPRKCQCYSALSKLWHADQCSLLSAALGSVMKPWIYVKVHQSEAILVSLYKVLLEARLMIHVLPAD